MRDFVAIDVETAQGKRWSICQVGLAIVENGEIKETISELVQPPNNEYSFWNTRIHGIKEKDTLNKPRFPEVWEKLKHIIDGRKLVAHNASFDISCLHQTMEFYNMEKPDFDSACTYKMTGKKLNVACDSLGIKLVNHHDAGSDANACAQIFLKLKGNQSNSAKREEKDNIISILENVHPINLRKLERINPGNAKELVAKNTGIYFWIHNSTDEIVYIGVGAGMNGLFNRIVRQHLNPKYIEYRSEKHNSKDSFQLSYPIMKIVKGEMKSGIDQSVFRRNIGRALQIKPGEATVNYILENLHLKCVEISDVEKLKKVEKEMINIFKPKYNNSHK